MVSILHLLDTFAAKHIVQSIQKHDKMTFNFPSFHSLHPHRSIRSFFLSLPFGDDDDVFFIVDLDTIRISLSMKCFSVIEWKRENVTISDAEFLNMVLLLDPNDSHNRGRKGTLFEHEYKKTRNKFLCTWFLDDFQNTTDDFLYGWVLQRNSFVCGWNRFFGAIFFLHGIDFIEFIWIHGAIHTMRYVYENWETSKWNFNIVSDDGKYVWPHEMMTAEMRWNAGSWSRH